MFTVILLFFLIIIFHGLTVGLSCEPEETVVKFNFTNPFRGVIQAGPSNSPCKIKGDGRKQYSLGVPHASCGTKHVVSSMTINTLLSPSSSCGCD